MLATISRAEMSALARIADSHCDYPSIVKVQGAFDELLRQSIGWIGDDRADTLSGA